MKYVLLLLGVAAIYYFLARSAPVRPVVGALTAEESVPRSAASRGLEVPAGSAVRQPLDRTQAALEQVEQRNGAGEF